MNQSSFLEQLGATSLPQQLRRYDPGVLLRAAMRSDAGTFAGFEALVTATAVCQTGNAVEIPLQALNRILIESEALLRREPADDALMLNWLRTVRGLRPIWFSGPLYAELLAPFSPRLKAVFGLSAQQVFAEVQRLADSKTDPTVISDDFQAVADGLTRSLNTISRPGDLWDCGFVDVGGIRLALTYKLADVVYRHLCARLQSSDSRFGSRKGKSLERFVRRRLVRLSPNWSWHPGYTIEGEGERDLIGFGAEAGLVVESKSYRFRGSSSDWSKLNARSDAEPVVEAVSQVQTGLRILRNGGRIRRSLGEGKPASVTKVSAKKFRHGMVITDEVYTPYVRACYDNFAPRAKQGRGDWHGEETWVASMLDLEFIVESAGTISLVLDYLKWLRSRKNIRYTDEPESWLLYGTEPILPAATRLAVNFIANGYDWTGARSAGLRRFRPPWLLRNDLVLRWDSLDRTAHAMQVIKQDRWKASKLSRRQMASTMR